MSVMYATGFGALNAVTPARWGTAYKWPFLSYDGLDLKTQQGSGNAEAVYAYMGIVTDPSLPSRKLLRFTHTYQNSGPEFIGIRVAASTEAQKGMVFGFTFTESYSGTTPAANAVSPYRHGLAVMSLNAGKTASSSIALADANQSILVLGDYKCLAPAQKFPLCVYGRNSFARPSNADVYYDIDAIHHCEVIIERASKRVRAYIDDQLIQDFTITDANISTFLQGMQIVMWRDGNYNASYVHTTDIGNIYMMEIDDIHTDRLGSSARVIDYAPASDRSVEMRNSNKDAAGNYQTADQMFDAASDYSLMARDTGSTDLYGIPQSLYSDAAIIHGVGVKVRAIDVAGGGHKIASAAMSNGKQRTGTESTMTASTSTLFSDASINPDTGNAWTVAELSAGAIGVKGGFK